MCWFNRKSEMINCKCPLSPIVRFINFKVIDGRKCVFLEDFADTLSNEDTLTKLNKCLTQHGFKGKVDTVDGFIIYGE